MLLQFFLIPPSQNIEPFKNSVYTVHARLGGVAVTFGPMIKQIYEKWGGVVLHSEYSQRTMELHFEEFLEMESLIDKLTSIDENTLCAA